jgi:AcrR family transcriptional regulator
MKKPNARERILGTASELFFQRGYSGVGINEIIEKAGTAKASFYQHFPSKESLCEAWLKLVHEQCEEFAEVLLAGAGTPGEKAGAYFDRLEHFLVESGFRGCPYSNTGAVSDEGCAGIREQIRVHKEATRRRFGQIAALAYADPVEAERIGDTLFLLHSGATGEAQNLRETWPVRVAREAAVALLEP